MHSPTPKQIVEKLNKHIIGQNAAKRAVAIALRNRFRRGELPEAMRREITPKNILLIGPTGVGKTEIARRLARLANAPFVKIEATKFTQVGYVGRDVESIVRDLMETSIKMTREEKYKEVEDEALQRAHQRIIEILSPKKQKRKFFHAVQSENKTEDEIQSDAKQFDSENIEIQSDAKQFDSENIIDAEVEEDSNKDIEIDLSATSKETLYKQLTSGELNDIEIEIDVQTSLMGVEIMAPPGMEEMTNQLTGLFQSLNNERSKKKKVPIKQAIKLIQQEEADALINEDDIKTQAITRAEENGIVFIDELDKVTQHQHKGGHDISREGVQRDLLPLVEGCTVSTRYGMVKTDHVLFIASGAFHLSKPSDLIPELQGRLPIRVELDPLKVEDFKKILTEPDASLTKQYQALLGTEDVSLSFTESGITRIAEVAFQVNENAENIGARRLHTVMERLLDQISFEAPDVAGKIYNIDAKFVDKNLKALVKDEDLSRFIL